MPKSQLLWMYSCSVAFLAIPVSSFLSPHASRTRGEAPAALVLPGKTKYRRVNHQAYRSIQRGKSSDADEKDDFFPKWMETRHIEDLGLLVGDLFAIVLASQLMGLLDVLNDPSFVKNGGWLQPVPTIPTTLGVLVERICTLSVIWIISAMSEEKSFSYSAVENEKTSILMALSIALNFVALRLLVGWILSLATSLDFNIGIQLRDCYFVVLLVPTFRYFYCQYVRR
eukprot:scaffold22681_cov146-Cylindrotheca_fusiformis.AAC.11